MPTENTISVKDQQIDVADLPLIAEQIVNEYDERKKRRKDLEKNWKEVDRQVAMEPELSHKRGANNKIDPGRKWLPEIELPLQAQTLEMLTADCRRLEFPRGREWFMARAAITDDYVLLGAMRQGEPYGRARFLLKRATLILEKEFV